jgi:hypothetical protein
VVAAVAADAGVAAGVVIVAARRCDECERRDRSERPTSAAMVGFLGSWCSWCSRCPPVGVGWVGVFDVCPRRSLDDHDDLVSSGGAAREWFGALVGLD